MISIGTWLICRCLPAGHLADNGWRAAKAEKQSVWLWEGSFKGFSYGLVVCVPESENE